jgi:hypothetical protein
VAVQWIPWCARGFVAGVLIAAATTPAAATTIEIAFTGLDLVYDGSAIYDAGATSGGLADPDDADPLASIAFFVDGALAGTLLSNISADVFIPGVTGIPAGPNVVHNLTTAGNPGFFDLLVGTSPLASEFLIIDLGEVGITYTDTNGVQLISGTATSNVLAQNLPFGLVIDEPLTITFSAQVLPGTLTDNGSDITGFDASGSGNISEPVTAVPAPAAGALFAAAFVALLAGRRRKATVRR